MKNLLKSLVPHLVAILLFIIASALYFSPEFKGKEIQSHDRMSYLASSKEMRDYADKGEQILWTSRVFSGMPMYQISASITWNVLQKINTFRHKLPVGFELSLGLMIGLYLAGLMLGFKVAFAVPLALVFGFSSWLLQSIEAWHVTKIQAISYMVPMMAAVIMAYRGKLLLGGALTTLFLALLIGANHIQIVYYSLFMVAIIAIVFLTQSLREKELPNYLKRSLALLGFGILGVLPNAATLMSTYDYSKESTRAGKSELTKSEQGETDGLSFDYAMRWSYGKMESFNLFIPGLYGGGHSLGENSNTVEALTKLGVPKKTALEYAKGVPMYYGDQPFTSGPTYLGASILFFFLLMFFLYKDPLKWALLTGFVLAMFFAWGQNFEIWNRLFFDNFPMFNKFRAPSMWLTLAIVSSIIGAGLAIKQLAERVYDEKRVIKAIYQSAGVLGGIALLFWLFGTSLVDSFVGSYDEQLKQSGFPVDAIVDDRIALMKSDAMRTLLFVLLSAGAAWLWVKKKLVKENTFAALIGVILIADFVTVGLRYLNNDDFVSVKGKETTIPANAANLSILQDQSINFRVFNTSVDPFNDNATSYFHQSVGGYSAVKLWRYQDMIEFQLSKGNQRVFDMLNTKYFIQGRPGEESARQNPNALGSVWFVETVIWAKNADEEMETLNTFNPANEVVIDQRFKNSVSENTFSAQGTIELVSFHPENMEYKSTSSEDQFAVFSEVWYKGNVDWKAYIDGKEVEFIRVNYMLRGLAIPAGDHQIVFKFYPKVFHQSNYLSLVGSLLALTFLSLATFRSLRGKE
jgi:hypothetical protein